MKNYRNVIIFLLHEESDAVPIFFPCSDYSFALFSLSHSDPLSFPDLSVLFSDLFTVFLISAPFHSLELAQSSSACKTRQRTPRRGVQSNSREKHYRTSKERLVEGPIQLYAGEVYS